MSVSATAALKSALRTELRAARGALDAATRGAASDRICDAIVARLRTHTPGTVGGYIAMPTEPDIGNALRTLKSCGWRTVIPRIEDDELCFDDVDLESTQLLPRGPFAIPEAPTAAQVPASEIDVLLVPLVGFDGANQRLGNGKGYYDRYLARSDAEHITTIGIAFEVSRCERVPTDPWDVALHDVITEATPA